MTIIKVKNVRKEWEGVTLFADVTFEIAEGERVLLFGRNGIGKTTLLQGLLGRLEFEEGSVYRSLPPEEWGMLDQQLEIGPDVTALAYVLSGSRELWAIKTRLECLSLRLQAAGGLDTAALAAYGEAYEHYLQLDGYGWEAKAEKSLTQLKLTPSVWHTPYHSLSGGQKTRVQLAGLLAREPRLLILDEPTNHLDGETMEWLEQWLCGYPGTVLYVSHDRMFIDRTATAILELGADGCRRYAGSYTQYREQKAVEARTLQTQARKQALEEEKLLASIRRYAEWFQQAHKAAGQNDFLRSKSKKNVSRLHAKEAALERLNKNRVELPRDTPKLRMHLESGDFEADTLLTLDQIGFAYTQGVPVLEGFNLSLRRGERLALLGPNGVGKSTLLKLMAGMQKPDQGEIRLHPRTKIGYFAQELDTLEESSTILDSLLELPGMTQAEARTILGCFLFRRDDVFKKIGDLSMGEKCRVAFVRLYFGKSNLLVLDEPTNYLDIDTRERVEEALQAYPGGLIVVSHDRYLHTRVANRLVILRPEGEPQFFPGSYEEYMSKDRSRTLTGTEQSREDERGLLELRRIQLIQSKAPETEEERKMLMAEIAAVQQRIREIGEMVEGKG
ncbi:ABC-F family ATP-binding cassette domain-containing protein [Paenibacillus albidus]|uniref:ribosomal protection-like ABC-F family protein n=1 Tax=Paenibacillus albidus TaxID=2041023 RepID=UPI001BE9DCE8|nr:ABC-F family ATP-binding cassette domain-containing protein [Paenibacillus albidus]MBT2291019.1 ABC-F family ATP-binding cassette domain-containing protein [Paenibacillus albidus]